jgi:NTP pyrophosphatase (non-canonical NTP hydrolase)
MTKRLSIKQKQQLEHYKRDKTMGHYAEQYEKSNLDFEKPSVGDLKKQLLSSSKSTETPVLKAHTGRVVVEEPDLTFNHYQYRARQTALYPKERALEYLSCGLAGEVGELCYMIAKYYKEDDPDKLNALVKVQSGLRAEIGDILWFLAELTTILDSKFGAIAQNNLDKLQDSKMRGLIKGKGDSR